MKNLVVCLGYDPKDDGLILPILENRLKDSIQFCRDNPGSTLLLMGSHTFRITNTDVPDQAIMMKEYIEVNAKEIIETTNIILENKASSAVAQLCFIRDFTSEGNSDIKLTIVASEFFVDRVMLYSEYILDNFNNINFIASSIPSEESEGLKEVEKEKLVKTKDWLSRHQKGDYLSILKEQKAFEQKIIKGEESFPVSTS